MLVCIAADGTWNQYEWADAQASPGGAPLIGFHTYVTGSEGTILTFGEGGGAPPGAKRVAPVVL